MHGRLNAVIAVICLGGTACMGMILVNYHIPWLFMKAWWNCRPNIGPCKSLHRWLWQYSGLGDIGFFSFCQPIGSDHFPWFLAWCLSESVSVWRVISTQRFAMQDRSGRVLSEWIWIGLIIELPSDGLNFGGIGGDLDLLPFGVVVMVIIRPELGTIHRVLWVWIIMY